MSRVYRYEEVAEFRCPGPEIFAAELEHMRTELSGLCDAGHVSGSFIYGSATYDAANPRSDIDLIAATPEITAGTTEGLRGLSVGVYERSGIPVDISCFTECDLLAGMHRYYKTNMVSWLQKQTELFPNNVIGQNPVDLIKPLESDLVADVDALLANDAHLFTMTYMKGRCLDPEGTLEAILNYPHKAGRESLSALQMHGYIPEDSLTSAKKSVVATAVTEVFGQVDPLIAELYADISIEFANYTGFVEQIAEHGITRDQYNRVVIAMLDANLPKAAELAQRMLAAYRSYANNRSSA